MVASSGRKHYKLDKVGKCLFLIVTLHSMLCDVLLLGLS